MVERRRFVRVDSHVSVSYQVIDAAKATSSTTQNISGSGLRFLAQHVLAVGTPLDITLHLPEHPQPIHFTGEVVWSQPLPQETHPSAAGYQADVSVRVVTMEPRDRVLILQHLLSSSPPALKGRTSVLDTA